MQSFSFINHVKLDKLYFNSRDNISRNNNKLFLNLKSAFYAAILMHIFILLSSLPSIESRKARCFMIPDPNVKSDLSGEVNFSQDNESSPLIIEAKIFGSANGNHGFHIHEKNTIEGGCDSAGAHFNPKNMGHGGLQGDIRHQGDMGNLLIENGKTSKNQFQTSNMTLFGDDSIIGRTCVIHQNQDDLGKGDNAASKINGNSGTKLACGIVQMHDPLYSMIFGIVILALGLALALYYFIYYKKHHDIQHSSLPDTEVRNI